MPLRMLPWAPEYGPALQFDVAEQLGADGEDAAAPRVDAEVERDEWAPVDPAGEAPAALQIVDGVRRAEAHAMDDGPDGRPLFGLFGSFAVGAVRCGDGPARIPEQHLRVERRYLQTGGEPHDREIEAGAATLKFRAEVFRSETGPNGLLGALHDSMRKAEANLAQGLSDDESVLTFVDGPLHMRSPGRRVLGYVKRIQNPYLDPGRFGLLRELRVGQRTPLFRIADRRDGYERYSWFLRLAELGDHYHTLGGVMRVEAPGTLPLHEAVALAGQSALALPRLASSPARDPRAPQNLTPVGALEAVLTHRLGDRRWLHRLITAAVGERAGAVAAATALVEGAPR